MHLFKDFFGFLKKPDDTQLALSIQQKLIFIGKLILFDLFFTFLIIFPLFNGINRVMTIKMPKLDYDETLVYIFTFYVLLVPFIEELIFRHFLRYKGWKTKCINSAKWKKIFPFLVYAFAVGFGLVHLSNYLNDSILFYLLAPLIVLPQLFGGLIITYIRVRLSFRWGLLHHCMWNFLITLAIPFVEATLSKPYTDTKPNYTLTIEEKPFIERKKPQILKIDSLNHKIYAIQVKQYSLQHLLDTLYSKNAFYVDDILIDLNFKSTQGVGKQEIKKILAKEYDIE